jgi:hypothetical protein
MRAIIALRAGNRTLGRQNGRCCCDNKSLQQERIGREDAERGTLCKRTLAKPIHSFMMWREGAFGNALR